MVFKRKVATKAEIEKALYRTRAGSYSGETQLVKSILAYLGMIGCRGFRRNVGGAKFGKDGTYVRFGTAGQADIWFVGPGGIHGEIEAKQPGLGKRSSPSRAQQDWLDEMARTGAIVISATSLEQFAAKLEVEFNARGLRWEPRWRLK